MLHPTGSHWQPYHTVVLPFCQAVASVPFCCDGCPPSHPIPLHQRTICPISLCWLSIPLCCTNPPILVAQFGVVELSGRAGLMFMLLGECLPVSVGSCWMFKVSETCLFFFFRLWQACITVLPLSSLGLHLGFSGPQPPTQAYFSG